MGVFYGTLRLLPIFKTIERKMNEAMVEQNRFVVLTYALGQTTTNYEMADCLSTNTPLSFKKAQDLLLVTEKLVKKKGFFISQSKRIGNVTIEYIHFVRALKTESNRFIIELDERGGLYFIFLYLNVLAYTFPNWPKEYKMLEVLIPQFYAMHGEEKFRNI